LVRWSLSRLELPGKNGYRDINNGSSDEENDRSPRPVFLRSGFGFLSFINLQVTYAHSYLSSFESLSAGGNSILLLMLPPEAAGLARDVPLFWSQRI